jgi:hypothetical protein
VTVQQLELCRGPRCAAALGSNTPLETINGVALRERVGEIRRLEPELTNKQEKEMIKK